MTVKENYQAARLATNTANDVAQALYGSKYKDDVTYKPVWSTLTADSADVNAEATAVTESGLSVTFPAVGVYRLEALILYTTAAAADIKIKFTAGTATVTGTVGTSDISAINAPGGDGTAARVPTLIGTSWTTAQTLATTGAIAAATPAFYTGKLVVTAVGTLTVQFTQGTSDASNTHINSGSYLMIERVA